METYQLDRVDNLLKILQNVDGQETEITTQMTTASKKLNQYSRFDQWNLAYDANGNLSKRGGQDFTYDYRNRMVSASESGTTVSFNYDALGRRIEKAGPQGTTRYYYAGNQVIEERNAAGQVTKQYIYGSGIDEVLRLDVYTGNTSTPYYFHTNQIGSTTAITDSDGNVVERVSYDTYGRPYFSDAEGQPLSSSSIGNTTLFQGREYDSETGLYHYRARAYDPVMGRFLQVDPLGYVDSMNLYQAFNMNPVNYLDPLGEDIVFVVGGPYKNNTYGHVALRVVGSGYDFTFDFGRYGNTWGRFNSEGEGILNIWENSFDRYIARESSTGRVSKSFRFTTTEEQDLQAIAFFNSLIKSEALFMQNFKAKDSSNLSYMARYRLSNDYHWATMNCTTISIEAFEHATGIVLPIDISGRGLGLKEKAALLFAGRPEKTYMPMDFLSVLEKMNGVFEIKVYQKKE